MFKVKSIYTDFQPLVYATIIDKDGDTRFLIYNQGWEWVQASDYEPIINQ